MKTTILALLLSVTTTGVARADDDVVYEARYVGLGETPDAAVLKSGAAGAYFCMVLGGLLCVGVMFKNARRTHLD
jgi:hypothetical protein